LHRCLGYEPTFNVSLAHVLLMELESLLDVLQGAELYVGIATGPPLPAVHREISTVPIGNTAETVRTSHDPD
jgi:hypothetical protein